MRAFFLRCVVMVLALLPIGRAVSSQLPAGSILPDEVGGYSLTDPAIRRLYGPGAFIMDSLGNLNVGVVKGFTYVASQRFRAAKAGAIASVRTYWADGPGYADGTGGTIRVRVYPDDGTADHFPDTRSQPLASGKYIPAMKLGRHDKSRFNDPVPMSGSGRLVEGGLYHVVYDNTDADPEANFLGLNCVATLVENGRPARWLSPVDWGVLYSATPVGASGYAWKDLSVRASNGTSYYAPILQLTLQDGSVLGNSNMETGNVEGRQWEVTSDAPVRERFSPTETRSISGFAVQTAAVVAGDLAWEFRQAGRVLAAGVIHQATADYRTSRGLGHETGVMRWRDVALPAPVTLAGGQTFDLVFTGVGDAVWRFADQRNGSAHDYRWPAAFSESEAQTRLFGFWIGANHWHHLLPSSGANWRVVLFTAP